MSADIERIRVSCPHCEKKLVMKAELAGRKVKCPQCETAFTVNANSAAPAKSVAVAEEKPVRSASVAVQSPSVRTTPTKPRSWTPPKDDDDEEKTKATKRKKAKRSSDGGGAFGPGLIRGLIFGLIAAGVSAGLWAFIGVAAGMQIGWLAWGVGIFCGFAVAMGCEETNDLQGFIAAACAVGGILLGKLLIVHFLIGPKLAEIAGGYWPVFQATFSPMSFVFIGLAVFSAYRLASGSSSSD